MTPRENGARGPSNTKMYGSGGDSLLYHTITYQKSHDMKGFAQKGGFSGSTKRQTAQIVKKRQKDIKQVRSNKDTSKKFLFKKMV